ncbi:hypothetical protein GW17_00057710, partial [Ensete ventricosum]
LAKVTNRAILEGLKRRVAGAQGTWVEKLPSILRALRTTPKTLTRESPYSLAFGTEAILPPKVVFSTLWVEYFEPKALEVGLRENLDLIEELRVKAHLRALMFQKAVARLYNTRVKLDSNWEGPYRVVRTIQDKTYVMSVMDDRVLPRTWHISNLKKFYV